MTSSYEVKQLPDSKYYLVRTDVRDCVVTHAIWRRLYADASILGQANDYQEILEQRRRIGHAKAYEAALPRRRRGFGSCVPHFDEDAKAIKEYFQEHHADNMVHA